MTDRRLAIALLVPLVLAGVASATGVGTAEPEAAANLRLLDPGACGASFEEGRIALTVQVDGDQVLQARTDPGEVAEPDHVFERFPAPGPGATMEVALFEAPEPEDPFARPNWTLCDAAPGAQRNWMTSWPAQTQRVELAGNGGARVHLVLGEAPVDPEGRTVDQGTTWVQMAWDVPEEARLRVRAESLEHGIDTEHLWVETPSVNLTGLCPGDEAFVHAAIETGPWLFRFQSPEATTAPGPLAAPYVVEVHEQDGSVEVVFEQRSVTEEAYELHVGTGAGFEPTDETELGRWKVPFSDRASISASLRDAGATHVRLVAVDGDRRNATPAFEIGEFSREEIDPPRPACLDTPARLEPAPLPADGAEETVDAPSSDASTPSEGGDGGGTAGSNATPSPGDGATADAPGLPAFLAVGLLALVGALGRRW